MLGYAKLIAFKIMDKKMERPHLNIHHLFILVLIVFTRMTAHAESTHLILPHKISPKAYIQPSAPHVAAKAYILVDANSGKIIAQKDATKRLPPASLTKMMTLYVVSHALKSGQIKLTDDVRVSKNAWKIGGSKMFLRAGQTVSVEDLVKGVIVDSGNDACVAIAEYLAGSEENFAKIMNQQAAALGMKNSHFTDSTGLPNKDHYSSAFDLAVLARALVKDFPEYYGWYKQKWFTFNGIKQPNRNRLLWRLNHVDGLKTGHTDEAGFCLVSSAKKKDMRLINVVLNAPSDAARSNSSERLLTYGFRFYETHKLYDQGEPITNVRVWKGKNKYISLGIKHPMYVTIPTGQYDQLAISTVLNKDITAPIEKGQQLGDIVVKLHDKEVKKQSLQALDNSPRSGIFGRMSDGISYSFHRLFGTKAS